MNQFLRQLKILINVNNQTESQIKYQKMDFKISNFNKNRIKIKTFNFKLSNQKKNLKFIIEDINLFQIINRMKIQIFKIKTKLYNYLNTFNFLF